MPSALQHTTIAHTDFHYFTNLN